MGSGGCGPALPHQLIKNAQCVCVCVGMGPRGKKKEVVAHSLTLITLARLSQCVLV